MCVDANAVHRRIAGWCAWLGVLQGSLGLGSDGYRQFHIEVHFFDFNVLSLASAPSYIVEYEETSFRVFSLVVRTVLVVTTAIMIVWWFVAHRKTPLKKWLPQRHWVSLLLFSIFLWQNPIIVFVQLYPDVRARALPGD